MSSSDLPPGALGIIADLHPTSVFGGCTSSSVQAISNPRPTQSTPLITQSTPQITTNFLRPPPTLSQPTPPPVNYTITGVTPPMLHEQFTSNPMTVQPHCPPAHMMTVDLSQPIPNSNETPNTLTPFPHMLCNPHLTVPQSFSIPSNATSSPQPHTPSGIAPTPAQIPPPRTQTVHLSSLHPNLSYAASLNIPKQTRNIPPLLPNIPLDYMAPGTHNGIPSVSFSEDEMSNVIPLFEHSLVLKFAGRNPALAKIREEVAKWGIVKPYSVGIIDYRHTLVRMTCLDDLRRAQSVEVHKIDGCLFRCLKWSPDFSPKKESSRRPIWVQFPWLPFTLYAHSYMSRIAATIGNLLRLDTPTMDCTRLRFARACIEVDLARPLPQGIWIITPNHEGFKQTIAYESNTSYCTRCSLHGHNLLNCRFIKPSPCSATNQSPLPQTVQSIPTTTANTNCNPFSTAPISTPHTKPPNTHTHFNSPLTNSQNANDSDEGASEVEVLSDQQDDRFDHLEGTDRILKPSKSKKKKNKSKKKSSTSNSESFLTSKEVDEALPSSSTYTHDQVYKESIVNLPLSEPLVVSKAACSAETAPTSTPSLLTVDPPSTHTTLPAPLERPDSEFVHSPMPSRAFLAMQSSLMDLRVAQATLQAQGKVSLPLASSVEEAVSDGYTDGFFALRNDPPG